MSQDDPLAVSRRIDELIRASDEPGAVLLELVREFGPERTAEDARVVFGSWRSRIDLVEQALEDILEEHGAGQS